MAYTYVLDMNKNPLMPCHNGGFIRTLLKEKKAKVVRNKPSVLLETIARIDAIPCIFIRKEEITVLWKSSMMQNISMDVIEKGNLERNCSMAERQEIKTTQVKICINTESKRYQKVKEV